MSDRAAHRIVLALALAGVACGHPEKKVVDQYFTALNAKDNQTLGSFALVSLDTKDKRVEEWKIVSVSQENRSPAPLVDLVSKQKEVEGALADNKKAYNAYFLDHPSEVDQVRDLLKKSAPIAAKLQPYATDWKKFTEKEKELKKALAEAKEAVEDEKRNVSLSIGTTEGLEDMTGDMVTKDLDLTLNVGGESQSYQMTLRKYEMTGAQAGPRVISRWVVYSLQLKG